MKLISELIDLLNLEQIGMNLYRGQSYQSPWGAVLP